MYNFNKDGFIIIKNRLLKLHISQAKDLFIKEFKSRFGPNISSNRELIKRFADHPYISTVLTSDVIVKIIQKKVGLKVPVKCGPLVSHYTSNDQTGSSYGLPYHQDYPSMASSKCSIICWLNLVDTGIDKHGIEILKGQHKKGLLKGKNTDSGYILNKKNTKDLKSVIPTMKAGELLIMSCFSPHKTHIHPDYSGWKLSLSQRYDDLSDKEWAIRGFKNAYKSIVARKLHSVTKL